MVRDILTLNTFEKRGLIILMSALVVSIGLYSYFVMQTALYGAEERRLRGEITELYGSTSVLSEAYLTQKEDITQTSAREAGFGKAGTQIFVSRGAENAVSLRLE